MAPNMCHRSSANLLKSTDSSTQPCSPHFPQSNGHAERVVKTAKKLLRNTKDPHMALLSYRLTPLPWCGLSLLMGRQIRSNIPLITSALVPLWQYFREFCNANKERKQKQNNFDDRHGVRLLPDIPKETEVTSENGRQVYLCYVICYLLSQHSKILSCGDTLRNTKMKQISPYCPTR